MQGIDSHITCPLGDEGELLARLLLQDRRAWTEFFDAYRDGVFRLFFRILGSREGAEDVSQEMFLKAVKFMASFRGEASLKTWLYQIAHNACLAHISSARKEASHRTDNAAAVERVASDSPDAERAAASGKLRGVLEDAIRELDFAFREAILLREVEGQSYEEIASATGVSVNTVKTRIHQARARLQQRLAEYR